MSDEEIIRANVESIRRRIAVACVRSGRPAEAVKLIAVTKYAELSHVRRLVDLGECELGESRPQQLVRRAAELPAAIHWHLIGHLQRNKVESVLPAGCLIHSVDSERLLRRIAEVAERQQQHAAVLLEVNVSGEAAKDGMSPDELRRLWPTVTGLAPQVDVRGLMTMAPASDHPDEARPVFRALRELRDELVSVQTVSPGGVRNLLPELSMGMSGDFETAIEEGATMVRIGSSLFAGLSAQHS